ncbi:hypothetical protein I6M63_13825 [Acinetobacter pittii]|nr:hypothetical protein [Acinetobacter pittii]
MSLPTSTPPKGLPMNNANKITLYWLTTTVGAVFFVTFQLFFYINDFVKIHGTTPVITFETNVLWMFSAFYGSWIITVLLALIGTRTAQWIVLTLGSLLVVLTTLGGIADGLRDGWHIAFTAILFVTLSGLFAISATWRNIKNTGDNHVNE